MLPKTFLITKCFVLLPEILSSVTITWGSVGCGWSSVLSRGGSVTWSSIPSQENSLQLKCQKKKVSPWSSGIGGSATKETREEKKEERDGQQEETTWHHDHGDGGDDDYGDGDGPSLMVMTKRRRPPDINVGQIDSSSLGEEIHRHHNHLQSRQAGGWR